MDEMKRQRKQAEQESARQERCRDLVSCTPHRMAKGRTFTKEADNKAQRRARTPAEQMLQR